MEKSIAERFTRGDGSVRFLSAAQPSAQRKLTAALLSPAAAPAACAKEAVQRRPPRRGAGQVHEAPERPLQRAAGTQGKQGEGDDVLNVQGEERCGKPNHLSLPAVPDIEETSTGLGHVLKMYAPLVERVRARLAEANYIEAREQTELLAANERVNSR